MTTPGPRNDGTPDTPDPSASSGGSESGKVEAPSGTQAALRGVRAWWDRQRVRDQRAYIGLVALFLPLILIAGGLVLHDKVTEDSCERANRLEAKIRAYELLDGGPTDYTKLDQYPSLDEMKQLLDDSADAISDCVSGSSRSDPVAAESSPDEAAPTPAPTPTPIPVPAGTANCSYAPDGSTASKEVGTPPSVANATGNYEATIQINKKPVVVELDAAAAPCAVNNFVYLAKAKYFDNTECHRELNSPGTYVLQCGDPDATGRGGPGYTFADENLEGATYEAGIVAMANAGIDTNGSQFFMMFKDSEFQPDYVPFGKIISGLDVLTDIANDGTKVSEETGANDVPKRKALIEKVAVSSAGPES